MDWTKRGLILLMLQLRQSLTTVAGAVSNRRSSTSINQRSGESMNGIEFVRRWPILTMLLPDRDIKTR